MSIFDFFWRGKTVHIDSDDDTEEVRREPPPVARVAGPPAERAASAAADISSYEHGRATWPTFTAGNAVANGMRLSTYAYRCIRLIAENAGSVPLNVEVRGPKGEWVVAPNHPLHVLVNNPNEHWSRSDLVELVSMHLDLTGRAYIAKCRVQGGGLDGQVGELWVLDPDKVSPIRDRVHYVSGFEHRTGDSAVEIYPTDDVCHLRLIDPADPHAGLGPTEAAAFAIDTEVEAAKWQRYQLKNDCRPGGILAFDRSLNVAQRESAEDKIEDRFKGGAGAGKILVVGSDAKYYRASNTPQEMDFVDSRRMSREETCSAYGVPPVLVGILDRATYSNFETALEVFWRLTMVPRLNMIAGGLTRSLAPEFAGSVRIVPDYSAIPQLNVIDRYTILSAGTLHRMGVPFGAINDRLAMGFPDLGEFSTTSMPAGAGGESASDDA